MRGLRALPVLLSLAFLSGCLGGGSFSFAGEGPGRAAGEGTCAGEARLMGEVVSESDAVAARVVDGAGRVLLDERIGDGPVDRTLKGVPGHWRMQVEAPEFDGRFRFEMRCG